MLTLTANRNWRILKKRWCAYWICSYKRVLLRTRGIQYMRNVCNAPTRNILYSTICSPVLYTYTMCDHFPSLWTPSCSLVHSYSVLLLVSYVLFVLCTKTKYTCHFWLKPNICRWQWRNCGESNHSDRIWQKLRTSKIRNSVLNFLSYISQ